MAQLGSADMLISSGFGGMPSNLTMPFRLAVVLTVVGPPPALTVYDAETQIARVRDKHCIQGARLGLCEVDSTHDG